jgi:hypothetical protein
MGEGEWGWLCVLYRVGNRDKREKKSKYEFKTVQIC